MSIVKANGAGDQSTGFYNGVATQGLRLNDNASQYLSRTPSTGGNRRTFTFSAWIKRANLDATNAGGGSDEKLQQWNINSDNVKLRDRFIIVQRS